MPAAAAVDNPPVYAIYARLSRKPKGRRRSDHESVERQEALCRKYAAEQGLIVSDAHVYVDHGRSAWKKGGARPAWDAMIGAGRRHEFAGVLAYKLDRFSRNMRDAEDLVDLAGKRRVMVDGPLSGKIDLATAHGRRAIREAAVQATGESDNTSERIRSALDERVRKGLLLGSGRLYGYQVLSTVREYDDDVLPVQRADEAAVVREVAQRMLTEPPEPLSRIAADLNSRGLTTVRGGKWTGASLGRMVGAVRYGGYIDYQGQRIKITGSSERPFTPILDQRTFERVQALLATRRRGRRPSGLWPLSGLLICGNPSCPVPGHTMAGVTSTRAHADGTFPRRYVCPLGGGGCGMSALAEPIEALVKARVLTHLADVGLTRALAAQSAALNDARVAAQGEIDRIDELLADLEIKRVARPPQIRERAYQAAKASLDRDIQAAERKQQQLGTTPSASPALPSLTAEEWDAATAAEKKTIISRLGLMITVSPQLPDGPRNRFDERRVVIEP